MTRPIAVNRSAGHTAVKHVVEQARIGSAAVIGEHLSGGHPHAAGRNAQVRRERRSACTGDWLLLVPVAHDAGLLLAARPAQKARHDTREHRSAAFGADRDPRQLNEELQRWIEERVRSMSASMPG